MINLKASNNLALGDCLGGYKSLQNFQAWRPAILTDQIRCLFIDSFRLPGGYDATKAEFTITKSGDDFTLTISYPTESGGWTDLNDIEFTLELNDVYQSTYDLGDIRIRRVLTGSNGTMTGRVGIPFNSPLGGDDLDISAGSVTRYGCIFLELEDATYIDEITAYGVIGGAVDTAACQIDLMAAAINTQRIASATTAPSGLTWTNTESIGTTVAAGTYALWFKTISSGAVGECAYVIKFDQGSGGEQEELVVIGKHRRYDATLDPYVVYGAYDGSIIEGAEIDSFASLPGTVALAAPPSGTRDYLLRVVARNKYGVESQNQLLRFPVSVDSGGADLTVPQTPSGVSLTFTSGGHAHLEFVYAFDTLNPVVYAQIEIGTETDLGFQIGGFSTYNARTFDPVLWGTSVTARVRFVDSKGKISDWATVTETALFSPASSPLEGAGRVGGHAQDICLPEYYGGYYDGDAALITEPGRVSFYYDGTLEFYAEWNNDNELIFYMGDYSLVNEDISGAQTDIIEDAGSGIVYISDGTTRRVKIDTVNKEFCATTFAQEITQCRREDAMSTVSSIIYMQAYPVTINNQQAPEPWMAFDGENVYLTTIEQS